MAMQSYLAHPDSSIRRLGMLLAEVISERTIEDDSIDVDDPQDEIEALQAGLTDAEPKKSKVKGGKRLKFDAIMWEGTGDGREEARWLRSSLDVRDNDAALDDDASSTAWLLGWDFPTMEIDPSGEKPPPTILPRPSKREGRLKEAKKAPRIVMLDVEQSADTLEGYAPASASSSRSASPDQSFLEEVAADPSLAIDAAGKKKVKRPVYISQLVALLKERESPDHLEVALKWGESLIRAKRSFGGELGTYSSRWAIQLRHRRGERGTCRNTHHCPQRPIQSG